MDFQKLIVHKLDKIEEKQEEHSSRLDIYNTHLQDHMARTEHLESRIVPIEDHMKFLMKLTKLATIVFSAISAIAAAIKLLQ